MTDAFRDKLRRLRREPAPDAAPALDRAAPAGPAARGGMPAWLRQRLDARRREVEGRGAPVALEPPRDLERQGDVLVRETRVPADSPHGAWTLGAALDADPAVLALVGRDPTLAGLDPARALYLDIETTGLSGGAGTWPFLVALGWFETASDGRREFVDWQGFLAGPHEERALLEAVAAKVGEHRQLVTFFGKSFDRHRLEDKLRLHSIRAPFAECLHLDLYYGFRRLYGGALPDGKLQTCERELLGFRRVDDLPGAFAPAAWFDFLAGRPHRLEEVFLHNHLDVLSLAALTGHLARALDETRPDGAPLEGCPLTRARALARLHADTKDRAGAVEWSARALERATPAAEREARLSHAEALRRADRTDDALPHLRALTEADDATAARACVLLARALRGDEARAAVVERGRALAGRWLVGGERDRAERTLRA